MKCLQARFMTPEAATIKNKQKSATGAPQKHYRLNLLTLIFKPTVSDRQNLNSTCNTQQLSATCRIFFIKLWWTASFNLSQLTRENVGCCSYKMKSTTVN